MVAKTDKVSNQIKTLASSRTWPETLVKWRTRHRPAQLRVRSWVTFLWAAVLVKEDWKISGITVNGQTHERARYELESFPHTKATIFRLLTALGKTDGDLLPQKDKTFTVRTPRNGPIKSDATLADNGDMLDCGACTAVNDSRILDAWDVDCRANLVDSIIITGVDNGWRIEIGPLSFHVVHNEGDGAMRPLAFALSKQAKQAISDHLKNLPEQLPASNLKNAATALRAGFTMNGCGKDGGKLGCLPCISQIAGCWRVTPTGDGCKNKKGNGTCNFAEDANRSHMETIVKGGHKEAIDVGVNSYLFSPLWINSSEQTPGVVHGFLVLGTPQREYDTPKRIHYSEHQLAAVRFASDYLELAISREKEAGKAADEKARADAVKHLEGIEPEVRSLLDDVNRMKQAAERVGRKISPAQHGVFAYDSETVKLFKKDAKFTVDLDILRGTRQAIWHTALGGGNSRTTATAQQCAEGDTLIRMDALLAAADKATWVPGLTLSIRAGEWHDSGKSWLFQAVHEPAGTEFLQKWNAYRRLFFVLGLARGNELMRAFAMYEVKDAEEARRLFNAAKVLFHRLHFPGNKSTPHVFTVQVLAALAGNPDPRCVARYNGMNLDTYADFVSLVATTTGLVRSQTT